MWLHVGFMWNGVWHKFCRALRADQTGSLSDLHNVEQLASIVYTFNMKVGPSETPGVSLPWS